jgi:hypothetical protein
MFDWICVKVEGEENPRFSEPYTSHGWEVAQQKAAEAQKEKPKAKVECTRTL